jgi:hypothetical protein
MLLYAHGRMFHDPAPSVLAMVVGAGLATLLPARRPAVDGRNP